MSPRILREGSLIFWFHSFDALHENRASVHVGRVCKMILMMPKSGSNPLFTLRVLVVR